jgi:hypothetical protein
MSSIPKFASERATAPMLSGLRGRTKTTRQFNFNGFIREIVAATGEAG